MQANSSEQVTFYVGLNGDDDNKGTSPDQPFATTSRAMTALLDRKSVNNGDRIVFLNSHPAPQTQMVTYYNCIYIIRIGLPEHQRVPSKWLPVRYVQTRKQSSGQSQISLVLQIEQAETFRANENKNGEFIEEDNRCKRICKLIREENPEVDISLIFLEQPEELKIANLDYAYHIKSVYRAVAVGRKKPYIDPKALPSEPSRTSFARPLEID